MLINPEIQDKVRQELDTVVGQERTPRFDDLQSARYFRAAWKESYRWRPPAPLCTWNHLL